MATGPGNDAVLNLIASGLLIAGGVAVSKAFEQVGKYLERREMRRDALMEELIELRIKDRLRTAQELEVKTQAIQELVRQEMATLTNGETS